MRPNGDPVEKKPELELLPGGSIVSGSPLPPSVSGALEEGDGSLEQRLERIAAFSPRRSRYTMLGEIAQGGMGRILRVWDEVLQRELAMKVVKTGIDAGSSADEREDHANRLTRFIEEARVTGQLGHPGIVPVHEIATDQNGDVFFTMPLVRGHTLKHVFELVRSGREGWTMHRALDVLHKVCMTVAFAHSRGVIHRDLKPENIMVGPFGETYTMDWGLALVEGKRASGAVVGTPAYMAPEQAHRVGEVGPRSDVYALGAILYELLGESVPHQRTIAENAERATIDRLIESPPRPIRKIAPNTPPELIAICDKAMAADANVRYASARDLARDMQAWLEGRVVQAHETGRLARIRKWRERNRLLSYSLEALVAFAFFSAIVLAVQQRSKLRTVEAKNREIKEESYSANLHAAKLHLRAREMVEARSRLAACAPELRGFEWEHLELSCDASASILPHELEVRVVAASDDGKLVATGSDDGAVRIWSSRGEFLRVLLGHTDGITALCFQPRTHRLFSGSGDHTVRAWDADGGAVGARSEIADRVSVLAVSPDGARIAIGSTDGSTVVRSTNALGEDLARLDATSSVAALAFEPERASLLVGDLTGHLRRWNVASEQVEREELFPRGLIQSIATGRSPDGSTRLFVAVGNQTLELHPERLVMTRVFSAHDGLITSIALHPDGDRLLTASHDHTLQMWDVESGTNTVTFVGHGDGVNSVAFLPGTPRFVSGSEDQTARIWLSGTEAVMTLEQDADDWVTAVAFSMDGSRLAVASRAGRLRLWSARDGTLLESIPTPPEVYCLAWTPDERIVIGGWDPSLRILTPGTEAPWEVLRGGDLFATVIDVDRATGRIFARYEEHSAFLWNAGEPQPSIVIEGLDDTSAAAFHPSGETLAMGTSRGSVEIRSAQSGEVIASLDDARAPITAIAYSVDGRRIAAGTRDRSILVWSTDKHDLLRALRGHENLITSLAFSPDGTRLTSGSLDKTIRLWDPQTGEALLTLREHDSGITAVAFSPDGTQIASASKDGTVRLWRTPAAIGTP